MRGLPSAPRRVARGALVLGITAALVPQIAKGETPARTVVVAAQGSVPGVKDADLNRFLADTMNAGVQGPWRFEPAPAGAAKAPDRIEWSVRSMASAEGTVRSFGFARAAIDRMMGKHQILSIDETLFLGGQFRTASHSEVPATKETPNPELAGNVVRSTQQLMASQAPDTTKALTPK